MEIIDIFFKIEDKNGSFFVYQFCPIVNESFDYYTVFRSNTVLGGLISVDLFTLVEYYLDITSITFFSIFYPWSSYRKKNRKDPSSNSFREALNKLYTTDEPINTKLSS